MTRPPTAAAALYPNLPRAEPVERPQHNQSLGEAMWPSLAPKPEPPPPSNRYQASTDVSLAARCDENPWLEEALALSGLKRKKRGNV